MNNIVLVETYIRIIIIALVVIIFLGVSLLNSKIKKPANNNNENCEECQIKTCINRKDIEKDNSK